MPEPDPLCSPWARLWLPALLLLLLAGCAATGPAAGPYPQFAEFVGWEVRQVEFAGELNLPEDSLHAVTVTRPSRCTIPILPVGVCIFGTDRFRLDQQELARDVARLQLYYRDHGFYGTRVAPIVEGLGSQRVLVRFAIVPGDRVILRDLAVEGTEEVIPPDELVGELPLDVGEPFRRTAFLASADTILAALYRRGYAYADVLRNYSIDTVADVAEASFAAIPGPLVRVDTIVIAGADRLDRTTVLRQLTFRAGDVLQVAELSRSQRQLYGLFMVNFASVGLAPDSLAVNPEPAAATVLVRIVEAPEYVVDASVGYGTIDCFRTGARWTDRNFLGGARRLEISGSLSKIGVGSPADWGLESGLCSALRDDRFSNEVNYRLAADFEQPRLFTTRERLTANVHAVRISELLAYLRESVGGQLALNRQITDRALLTTTLDVERGYTRADPVIFCIAFEICTAAIQRSLQQTRWSNALTAAASYDRLENARNFGYVLRSSVSWASPILVPATEDDAFADEYVRLLAEGSAVRELRPGWILAGNLRLGTFLRGTLDPRQQFIPPEQRFYAGGPNSVRGFPRNALGSQAYVADEALVSVDSATGVADTVGFRFDDGSPRSSAAGGTRLAIGSVELRTPSPLLPQFTRLAAFVDAGQVWSPAAETRLGAAPIYVTPGVGIRFITPVGPIRIDVGYNPYGRGAGPLYLVDEDDEDRRLALVRSRYEPPVDTFWDRLQFHFAVGQAF